ncbi:MAG TPA: hypothetical protein VF155_12655 [Candidatus Dormibacteraeota bacterium]
MTTRVLSSSLYVVRKLKLARVRRRVFLERLTEPLHLNAIAALVWMFGSYRDRIAFDLVVRPQHAFGILRAADEAKRLGLSTVTLVEFGVASGAGLMNMAYIAERVTLETGVAFKLFGFDTGAGCRHRWIIAITPSTTRPVTFRWTSASFVPCCPHRRPWSSVTSETPCRAFSSS